MPFRIGPMELIILLVIIMIVFGVGKLPEVGQSLGKAIREFKSAQNESDKVLSTDAKADEPAADSAKTEGTKTV